MPADYRTVDAVQNVIDRTKDKRPTEATVYGIDGDRVDLRIDDSVAIVRHVQVVGDVGLIDVGDTVQLQWTKDGRPIVLLVGSGSTGSTVVAADNESIENSSGGLRIKPGGVKLYHLGFGLQEFSDIFKDAGWQVEPDTGTIYHTGIRLTPSGDITVGSGEDIVKLSALGAVDDPSSPEDDTEYRLWIGASAPHQAPFRVMKDGSAIIGAGRIGGWNATPARLYSDAGNSVLHAGARPFLGMGTEEYGGTGFWAGKDTDYVYKVSIGEAGGPQLTYNGTDLTLQDIDLKFYYGTNLTLWIQSDGDFAIGSDIDTVSSTSLRIFSNDQTYDGEAFTAGDIIIGDHGGAHMTWDQSAGQLQFRDGASTGTPTRAYIDTDGSIMFGDGQGRLDDTGFVLEASVDRNAEYYWNSVNWVDNLGGSEVLRGRISGADGEVWIRVPEGRVSLGAGTPSNDVAWLQVYGADGGEFVYWGYNSSLSGVNTSGDLQHFVLADPFTSGSSPGFGHRTAWYLQDGSSSLSQAAYMDVIWIEGIGGAEPGSAFKFYAHPDAGMTELFRIGPLDSDTATTEHPFAAVVNPQSHSEGNFLVLGSSEKRLIETDSADGTVIFEPFRIYIKHGAAANPPPGYGTLYVSSANGHLYWRSDETGNPTYDLTSGGNSDHGFLSGLGDDDHTQYFLLAGETTNAELHSGAGLSVYADAGSTLVASIDTTGLGRFNSVSTDAIYYIGGNLTISTASSGSINIQPVSGITNITGNLVATGDLEATDIDLEDSTQPWMNILATGDTTYGRVGRALPGDRLDFWQNLDYVGASYTPDDATAGSAMIVLHDDAGVGKITMYAQDAQTGPVSITNAFQISESEIVFGEESPADINVRMEGVNLDDVFFMDSGTDQIYLGGQSGLDSSFMLGMQALDVSGTGREALQSTGIAIGNLEGSGDTHMYLQYLDYDYLAAGTWLADFAIMGVNQYYDESSDAWAQTDGTYPGIIFEIYTTKHTSKYPNFALFYSPAGTPATQYNWLSGSAGIADSGVVFNENATDLNLRVEGDNDPNLFFVDGGTGQVMIGNTAANVSPPSGGTIGTSMERLWVLNEDDYAGMSLASIRDDAGLALSGITGYAASGTPASPAATQSGDYLFVASGRGWTTTWETTSALMAFVATETYQAGQAGANIIFETKPIGTNTRVETLHMNGSEIVFNDDGGDMDFRVESDTVDDLLFINAGEDTVYIGGQSGGPNDDSAHLVLQARDPVQSLTDYETGIMLGEFESAGEGMALQYLDYNAGANFKAYFSILSSNVYWDASSDQWEFFNNQRGGIIFQIFQRYDSNNDSANFGLGYYKENVGGSPTTFVNWISGTSYNTSSANDELIINDNNEDMDVIFKGDAENHVLFIRGSDGNIGIGHSAPYYALVVGDGASPYTDPAIGIRSGTSNLGTIAFGDGDTGADRYSGYVEYNHSTGILSLGAEASVRASNWLELPELGTGSTPSTGEPATGYGALYVKSDGNLYFKNDSGSEEQITTLT